MRNQSTLVKSAFLPACFCVMATGINADIHTAASCSYADVLSASTACSAGDTVRVPAGSAEWNSTLVIKKAVSMIGAGSGLTTLVNSNFKRQSFIKIALPSDGFVRISGIRFDLVNNTSGTYSCGVWVVGGNTTAGGTLPDIGNIGITKIRIDHCTFKKGQRQVYWDGWAYGVMDHDSLINGEQSVLLVGDNALAWTRPIAPGTADAVYIESNVFIADSNFGGGKQDEFIYHQEGARSVTRHNKFDTRGYKKDWGFFDSHGNWGTPTTTYRGQPMIEVYANEFSAYKTYRFTYFRGGSILFYDNIFTTEQPGSPSTIELSEEESWTSGGLWCPACPVKTTWPAQDQINNTFIWNNTFNGSPIQNVSLNLTGTDSVFIKKDRDYFMHSPAASGGKETYAGSPGGAMSFSASGPNAYYPYTPYPFPHPLTRGADQASISRKRPLVQRKTPPVRSASEKMNCRIFSMNGVKISSAISGNRINHGVYIIMDNDRLKARKVQFVE